MCLLLMYSPSGIFVLFFDIVFHRAEIFNVMKSRLLNFFSQILPLVLHLKSHLHAQYHLGFLFIFQDFYSFIFRPMINFQLFFMKVVRLVSRFFFFNVDVQLFQYHFLKKYLYSFVLPLLLGQDLLGSRYIYGAISGLSILCH